MTPRTPHRRATGGTVPPRPPERASEPAKSSGEPQILKAKAADDDPRAWGDAPEDRDSWLAEQRPPHWD